MAGIAVLLVLGGWLLLARSAPALAQPRFKIVEMPPPPPAPPELAGQVLLAGCRQGECGWVRIVRLENVADSSHGVLRRIILRRGNSTESGDAPAPADIGWEPADRADYVFCSTERPAYAFPGDDGRYLIHYLDLFALAGYNISSAGLYVRFCHGQEFDSENEKSIRALGYRPGTRNEQVEDARPEDMAAF